MVCVGSGTGVVVARLPPSLGCQPDLFRVSSVGGASRPFFSFFSPRGTLASVVGLLALPPASLCFPAAVCIVMDYLEVAIVLDYLVGQGDTVQGVSSACMKSGILFGLVCARGRPVRSVRT